MAKWDVTTAEGLEALERFLMERMGFEWGPGSDGKYYWRWGGLALPEGWIFSGDGMVWVKEWAAEEYGLRLESWVDRDRGTCAVHRPTGEHKGIVFMTPAGVESGQDEPTAVALALTRALEEMEGEDAR